MSVSKEFMDIVAQGDKNAVRASLANYMILDRSYKLFDESFSYARSKMNLVDEHDGQELTSDRGKWTEEYLNEQLVAIVINFSQKRISHIKQVIPVALKASCPVSENDPKQKSSTNSRTGRKRTEREIPTTQKTQPVQSNQVREQTKGVKKSSGRTGRTIISEKEISNHEEDNHFLSDRLDYGAVLIIGGIAVAAVGVAVSEPIVIGAGIVATSSGCVIKVSKRKHDERKNRYGK